MRTKIKWTKIKNGVPQCKYDTEVIASVEGLSMNASEYREFKILTWRPKLKCFLEWNSNECIKYNDGTAIPGQPVVTAWSYFNEFDD